MIGGDTYGYWGILGDTKGTLVNVYGEGETGIFKQRGVQHGGGEDDY